MIRASEAIEAINRVRGEAVVFGIMTPSRYWDNASERPELDVPVYGGMGKASSMALGLALARPERKVLILDGDGSVLMNLGALVTIAGHKPENLVHFVFDDGVYMTTGGQPVPSVGTYDMTGLARGAGYVESREFDNLEDFVSELPGILTAQGPIFVNLKVEHRGEAPALQSVKNTGQALRQLKSALEGGTDA